MTTTKLVRAVMDDQIMGRPPLRFVSEVLLREARLDIVDQEAGRVPVRGLDEILS